MAVDRCFRRSLAIIPTTAAFLFASHASQAEIDIRSGPTGFARVTVSQGDTTLWRGQVPRGLDPIAAYTLADGRVRVETSSSVLEFSEWGRLTSNSQREAPYREGTPTGSEVGQWTDLEPIGSSPEAEYDVAVPPLVADDGAALLVARSSADSTTGIEVFRKNGTDSDTTFEHSFVTSDLIGAYAAAMNGDDVLIAFRQISGVDNLLRTISYSPESGWSDPVTLASTTALFQEVDVAADLSGNFVVSYAVQEGPSAGMSTFFLGAESGAWEGPVRVSPESEGDIALPTLQANRGGSAVVALYEVREGASKGLYVRDLLTPNLEWGPAQRVPGTRRSEIPIAGAIANFPITVDDSGDLTIPYYVPIEFGPSVLQLFRAVRREGGEWTTPPNAAVQLPVWCAVRRTRGRRLLGEWRRPHYLQAGIRQSAGTTNGRMGA